MCGRTDLPGAGRRWSFGQRGSRGGATATAARRRSDGELNGWRRYGADRRAAVAVLGSFHADGLRAGNGVGLRVILEGGEEGKENVICVFVNRYSQLSPTRVGDSGRLYRQTAILFDAGDGPASVTFLRLVEG